MTQIEKTLFVVVIENKGGSQTEILIRAVNKRAALAHVATAHKASAEDVARIGSESIEEVETVK